MSSEQKKLPIDESRANPPQSVREHPAETETSKNKVVINNPDVENKIKPLLGYLKDVPKDFSGTLVLSDNSTFQQEDNKRIKKKIKQKRIENRGKLFRVKSEPPKFCNSIKSVIMHVENGVIQNARFSGVPCNSWSCPNCGPRKAQSLRIKLTKVAQLNDLLYFMTLTLDPKKLDKKEKADTHSYITKKFNHLKTILKRKRYRYYDEKFERYFTFDLSKGEKLKYLWVVEFQKNGNAHMHILCNQFLPAVVIRKVWQEVGGGHRIDIQNARSIERVSNYISGYLIKGLKNTNKKANRGYGFRYGQRRYSISRSCEKPEFNIQKAFDNASFENKKKILKSQNLGWIAEELENNKDDILEVNFDE